MALTIEEAVRLADQQLYFEENLRMHYFLFREELEREAREAKLVPGDDQWEALGLHVDIDDYTLRITTDLAGAHFEWIHKYNDDGAQVEHYDCLTYEELLDPMEQSRFIQNRLASQF